MTIRVEYRAIADRPPVEDESVSELVREFALLKVADAVHEPSGERHVRLGQVVMELRSRGILD